MNWTATAALLGPLVFASADNPVMFAVPMALQSGLNTPSAGDAPMPTAIPVPPASEPLVGPTGLAREPTTAPAPAPMPVEVPVRVAPEDLAPHTLMDGQRRGPNEQLIRAHWVRSLADTCCYGAPSVAELANGDIVAAGHRIVRFDPDTGKTLEGPSIMYLIGFSADGQQKWRRDIPTRGDFRIEAQAAAGAEAGFYVAVETRQSMELSPPVPGPTHHDKVALIRFDDRGKTLWHRSFEGSIHQYVSGVEPHPDGGVVIAGRLGPKYYNLVHVSSAGETVWSSHVGPAHDNLITSGLETGFDGSFVVTGRYFRPLSDGEFQLPAPDNANQAIALFDRNGVLTRLGRVDTEHTFRASRATIDRDGQLWVTGYLADPPPFSPPLGERGTGPNSSWFGVVSRVGPDWTLTDCHWLQGSDLAGFSRLVPLPAGGIIAVGKHSYTARWGGQERDAGRCGDALLVRLNKRAEVEWTRTFEDTYSTSERISSITMSNSGQLIAGGSLANSATLQLTDGSYERRRGASVLLLDVDSADDESHTQAIHTPTVPWGSARGR